MRLGALVCVLLASVRAWAQAPDPDKLAAVARCTDHEADCDWLATLGSLEQQSITRAIAARGYELEPQPWGKIIGKVEVYNEDVFAETNRLQLLNHLHYTTRESATRGELAIHAGELWDQARVEESARLLRDPLFTSVVIAVPVRSQEPGKVDLLVVTRDVWSLRLNTAYTVQEGEGAGTIHHNKDPFYGVLGYGLALGSPDAILGGAIGLAYAAIDQPLHLTNLSFSLSENNFLGNRDVVAAAFTMDQGALAMGPLFIDKNLAGEHLALSIRIDDIITRQQLAPGDHKGFEDGGGFHSEGSDSTISLSRPMWSLASEWAYGVSFSHRFAIQRSYQGIGLRTFDDPNTAAVEALPFEYKLKTINAGAFVTRQWGSWLKQQLTLGYTISSVRPSFLDTFPVDPEERTAFRDGVFPRSEVVSQPYIEYSFFMPRFKVLRNVGTYDLAEDARYGLDLDVSFGEGLVLGADVPFERPAISLGYTFPWCHDGFLRIATGAGLRIQQGATIDNTASWSMRFATPTYFKLGRIVAQSELDTRWNDTQNSFFGIGGDPLLRGFAINQFIGERRIIAQVEARTLPVPIWVFRAGGVLFWDSGGAANSLAEIRIHNDVGFGVRALIPQTSRSVFRFDLAFPLDGVGAGTPHFIAAFDSAF